MILFDNEDMTGTVPTGVVAEALKGVFHLSTPSMR